MTFDSISFKTRTVLMTIYRQAPTKIQKKNNLKVKRISAHAACC